MLCLEKNFDLQKNSLNCEIPDFFASNSFQKKQSYQLKKYPAVVREETRRCAWLSAALKNKLIINKESVIQVWRSLKKIPDLAPEKFFGCMFRCNNCKKKNVVKKNCFLKIKLGKKFNFIFKKVKFFSLLSWGKITISSFEFDVVIL